MLQGTAGHNRSAGQRSSSILTGILLGLARLHTPGWRLTSGLKGADGEGRATGSPAEVDGQHWIYVFPKAFSYGPYGLFQKETRLLKSHAGLSIVHEEDGNSCSFNLSLMSPLLLWWDEKGHGGIHACVSGCAGCQEGQEGQLGCASPKLDESDFPAGHLEGLRRGEVS